MNRRKKSSFKTVKYIALPVLGIAFLLWYISAAGMDVVYSDYFRLIDEYLPDVTDISKILVPDILTRIPAMFAARVVNVQMFYLSVTFDRLLTVLGFVLIAVTLTFYSLRHDIGFFWYLAVQIVLFSLIKWEIILNGTAWAHIVSFGLFFINYYLTDLAWMGETNARQELLLCAMPFVWLLFAGEYIASYAVTMMLIAVLGILTGGANSWSAKREQRLFSRVFVSTLAALLLYLLSRHYAVWEHAGATDASFIDIFKEMPLYFVRFFTKTFAGAAIGQEQIQNIFGTGKALPDAVVLAIGIIIILTYLIAFGAYIKYELMDESIFPFILLLSGFINHAVVTAGRWIFLSEDYSLSSRYSGQFMIGFIGMILTFSMVKEKRRRPGKRNNALRNTAQIMAAFGLSLILILNIYTSISEIRKAPYREANYENMAQVIKTYDKYSDEELCRTLEWHKDPATLKNALKILKDNRLNVFDTMRQ